MIYSKEKTRRGLIIAVVALSIVLAIALGALLWLELKPDAHDDGKKQLQTQPNTEHPGASDQDTEDGIQTPYLTLQFDEALVDHVAVVDSLGPPYIAEFYAIVEDRPAQRVFDILMGDGADGNLCTIETDAGKTAVSIIVYTFAPDDSWTNDEINTVLAVQDCVNDLIDQMMNYQVGDSGPGPQISTETPESNCYEYVEIATPYGELLYPDRWEAYLRTEQTENSVMFYCELDEKEPVLLFTLFFGGDEGEQLGVVKNDRNEAVPVNLLLEELSGYDYEETDMTVLFEMQEAVNLLIEQMPLE